MTNFTRLFPVPARFCFRRRGAGAIWGGFVVICVSTMLLSCVTGERRV